ncbi:hypothetical protein BH11PLA2_BH11PLA2_27110 [soil metagenome]
MRGEGNYNILMDFLTRFTVNTTLLNPPSLQLLFGNTPQAPAEHVMAALRAYHPDLAAATVEVVNVADVPGADAVINGDGPSPIVLGLITWGKHIIKLVGFDAPMPASAVEGCLQPALLPAEVKADAKAHTSHILLYYAGSDENPLEQCVALAAVAGVFGEFGSIVTLNEEARAAVLSSDLLPDDPHEDMLQVLRALPLPYLYTGFVKMLLTDIPGVWMRTFAASRFGLPNFAYHATDHSEGQATFGLFAALLGYIREMKLPLEDGEQMRFDEDRVYRIRKPVVAEWWLESTGDLWVLERC